MPCDDTCNVKPQTCDDVVNKSTDVTSSICQYRETCSCPQGTVAYNQTCIDASECPVCQGKYKDGDKWTDPNDPCKENICDSGVTKSVYYRCDQTLKTECTALGMKSIVVSDSDACCEERACVCMPNLCPEKVR